MTSQPPQKPDHGFIFGVVLGAFAGISALMLSENKSGKKIRKQVENRVTKIISDLRTKYPEYSQEVDSILASALAEARKASLEISKASKNATSLAKSKSDIMQETLSSSKQIKTKLEKRFFNKHGKSLQPD